MTTSKTLTTTAPLEHAHCQPSLTDTTVDGSSSKNIIQSNEEKEGPCECSQLGLTFGISEIPE